MPVTVFQIDRRGQAKPVSCLGFRLTRQRQISERIQKENAERTQRIQLEEAIMRTQTTHFVIATDMICADNDFWKIFAKAIAVEALLGPTFIGTDAEATILTPKSKKNEDQEPTWYTTALPDDLHRLRRELCHRKRPVEGNTQTNLTMSQILAETIGAINARPETPINGVMLIAEDGCDSGALYLAEEFKKRNIKFFVFDDSAQNKKNNWDEINVARKDLVALAKEAGGVHLTFDRNDIMGLASCLQTASVLCTNQLAKIDDFMKQSARSAKAEELLEKSLRVFSYPPSVRQMLSATARTYG